MALFTNVDILFDDNCDSSLELRAWSLELRTPSLSSML